MRGIPESVSVPREAGRDSFRVRVLDAAADGRLGMHGVVGWLQEAATWHAHALGVGLDWTRATGKAWVLARLYVRMAGYPEIGARVAVATWPCALESRRALRSFVLWADDGSGPVIGAAATSWVLIDVARRRPLVIADAAEGRIPVLGPGVVEFPGATVAGPAEVEHRVTILPRPSDLDLQGHVNNARLAAWVLDATHGAMEQPFQPDALDIAYRAECRLGDSVEATMGGDDAGRRRIALARGDGGEIVRATVSNRFGALG